MGIKFMCKRSGNIVEFTEPHDIAELRKQIADYEEVKEEDLKKEEVKQKKSQPA